MLAATGGAAFPPQPPLGNILGMSNMLLTTSVFGVVSCPSCPTAA